MISVLRMTAGLDIINNVDVLFLKYHSLDFASIMRGGTEWISFLLHICIYFVFDSQLTIFGCECTVIFLMLSVSANDSRS